jgi:hypothetical protein
VSSGFAVTFSTAILSVTRILKHVKDLANLIFQYAFQKHTYYKLYIVLIFYCACVLPFKLYCFQSKSEISSEKYENKHPQYTDQIIPTLLCGTDMHL